MDDTERRDLHQTVLEDLDMFWRSWWLAPETVSAADLRRGSAILRRLLVDGAIQRAWISVGLAREPSLLGPDIRELASREGLRLELAVSCIAGGGRHRQIDWAFIGAFRVENPTTGVRADADVGFAVCQTCIARDAFSPKSSDLDSLVEKPWPLAAYLESVGAVRKGELIKRREIIKYFANYKGGVHLGNMTRPVAKDQNRYELIEEMKGKLHTDTRDSLAFELLSMGQAVARSPDTRRLAAALSTRSPHGGS